MYSNSYLLVKLFIKAFILCLMTVIVIATGCTQSELPKKSTETKQEEALEEIYLSDIKLNVKKIYCWINLMPGAESRFHITGEFEILKSINYDLNFIKLSEVKIFQEGKILFNVNPKINSELKDTRDNKLITFSTVQGLLVHPNLSVDKTIDMLLVFKENNDELTYQISELRIEKVY